MAQIVALQYQIWVDNGAPQIYVIQAAQPISDSALNDIADIIAADIPGGGGAVSNLEKAEAVNVTVT